MQPGATQVCLNHYVPLAAVYLELREIKFSAANCLLADADIQEISLRTTEPVRTLSVHNLHSEPVRSVLSRLAQLRFYKRFDTST